jgi:hypothetical protein
MKCKSAPFSVKGVWNSSDILHKHTVLERKPWEEAAEGRARNGGSVGQY